MGDTTPPVTDFAQHQLFDPGKSIQVNDITDDAALGQALGQAQPEAVINCVGLIKQHNQASDKALMRHINAEFPIAWPGSVPRLANG